jgi:hypothetical protein
MELKVVVRFLEAHALYSVTPEGENVFHACLEKYEGAAGVQPPESILLVKGIRRWIGSCDNPSFINELGQAIDTEISTQEQVFFGKRASHKPIS